MAPQTVADAALLDRYVPRIATNWDVDAPGRTWQGLDASLVFVDISGFTNLSEKLSRRGRIGAEELTSVLNYVFGNMLDIAYLQGGSLLKFGGDALLLMFTGQDHASRAASAAVEMRTALKAAVEYRTSVGRLRLRMSVGIHSGLVHLFRVGSSHQELVIAGPGASAVTAMEKAADPGQILVSSGTRDRLPDGAIGEQKGEGWLLRWRKAHCIAPGPVGREARDPEVLCRWVPRGLRDYLSAGETEPEHRIATVGFVRYCGVDLRMETDGPDWVADAIGETMVCIQDAADAEGVTFLATDINDDGGKAILVAGAPAALEEDEGRLLRAVRAIVDSGAPLDVHIGVNRGHVFTGEVGTGFRSTYTVMGDTVNLSARLMAAAPAGHIYATPGVLEQSGTLFATDALEPFHVKGKEQPVHAYDVGDELGERSRDARGELPFVGRHEKLARIVDAIEDASKGAGSVISVIGDTGVGKSRLIREAQAQGPSVPVLSVHAEPYGAATPYRPFRDPFRSILGIERGEQDEMAAAMTERVAAIDPELLRMLPLLADVAHIEIPDTPQTAAIEPKFRMDRLADAMVRLLDRVFDDPVVVNVEDAQWMDEASVHLLSRFADTVDERPWAIVISRRGDEGGFTAPSGDVIRLGELTQEESEQLVIEATRAAPLRPHEMKAIVARAEGNPLFLGEILRIVRESGGTDELPDSLGTVVSTGIDALPPLTRRILRYCSVFGRSFRISAVRQILAQDDLELDAATQLLLAGFLEPNGEGRLRFRTAMVRDVAYGGLSFKRRRDIHLRAAVAIEQEVDNPDDSADQLAMHFSLGGSDERTWYYALIAASRSVRAFANTEAAFQYERAIAAGRRLPMIGSEQLVETWISLGDVREQAGLFDTALDAYRKAYRLIDDDVVGRAETVLKRAWVRERAADYTMALRDASQAQRLVADADPDSVVRIRAQAVAFRALVRLRQGKLKDAMRLAVEAAADAEKSGDKAALARAYSVMAWSNVISEDPDALELCQQSLELYEEVGDVAGQTRMSNNLGVLAYFDGRWDDALEYYERSRGGAERVGNVVLAGFGESNIGELLVNQRKFDEAESHLEAAARVFRATGDVSMALFSELQLARVYMERGDLDKAGIAFEAVVEESRDSGFTANAAEAAIYLADCTIRGGGFEGALSELDRAMTDAGEQAAMFDLASTRLRGVALAGSGRLEEALEVLEGGLASARQRGQRYDEALLLTALSSTLESRDRARSVTTLAEADAILDGFGVRLPND